MYPMTAAEREHVHDTWGASGEAACDWLCTARTPVLKDKVYVRPDGPWCDVANGLPVVVSPCRSAVCEVWDGKKVRDGVAVFDRAGGGDFLSWRCPDTGNRFRALSWRYKVVEESVKPL